MKFQYGRLVHSENRRKAFVHEIHLRRTASAVANDVCTYRPDFSMPNFTPFSESSRTQKFMNRMAFELRKLAQEFGRSQWGPIRPPPPNRMCD